jgi:excinuclease UvrABC nuclease subunit
MLAAADDLEFERAAELRDRIDAIRARESGQTDARPAKGKPRATRKGG